MKVRITHVQTGVTSDSEETIIAVRWCDDATGETGTAEVALMIDWLDRMSGEAYVGLGPDRSRVGIVRPAEAPAYLRTYSDNNPGNNLLALPRF